MHLYKLSGLCKAALVMWKKLLPLSILPFLMAGCAATFTNLTPLRQTRNADNQYPVEVSLNTRQQTVRWESIKPYVAVGTDLYPMRPTPLMTNRWEGLVPVAAGTNIVHYRYKFDFDYNAMGKPKQDSAMSPEYTLRILDK
jgi:hypothetical protein